MSDDATNWNLTQEQHEDFDRRSRVFVDNICTMHEQAEKQGDLLRFYYLGWSLVALTGLNVNKQ